MVEYQLDLRMYVEGVGQKSGPCTATFNDLLCFRFTYTESLIPYGIKMANYVIDRNHHDFILRIESIKITLIIILI
jgi:hypothetical protein